MREIRERERLGKERVVIERERETLREIGREELKDL
jgi:hypothetical protein